MKNVLLLSAALFIAASMSSCKKDYTCSCSASGIAVGSYPINNATKSNATSSCNTEASTLTTTSGTTVTCSLN